MTLFLSMRTAHTSGSIRKPVLYEGGAEEVFPAREIPASQIKARLRGLRLVFATHGFNVNQSEGQCALARLEVQLQLPQVYAFVAVLWPGDFWIPAVNYPFEGATSVTCGKYLAGFCNENLRDVVDVSLISHSLGARLVLETVRWLKLPVDMVCLTAGAINNDCLIREYAAAAAKIARPVVLASERDEILRLAFPAGDFFGGWFTPGPQSGKPALGRTGPDAASRRVPRPWQIPPGENGGQGYGHGNYLPPSDAGETFPDPAGPWVKTAAFMRHACLAERQSWPPPYVFG